MPVEPTISTVNVNDLVREAIEADRRGRTFSPDEIAQAEQRAVDAIAAWLRDQARRKLLQDLGPMGNAETAYACAKIKEAAVLVTQAYADAIERGEFKTQAKE